MAAKAKIIQQKVFIMSTYWVFYELKKKEYVNE